MSAILDICLENRYEAEAAMELEAEAAPLPIGSEGVFGFDLNGEEIDLRQAIRELAGARRDGQSAARLAARFHDTLARAIAAACVRVRSGEGLGRVCLSGGSFQNMRLLEAAASELERAGFDVFLHSEIPPNDGGLSLGQAVIACARVEG